MSYMGLLYKTTRWPLTCDCHISNYYTRWPLALINEPVTMSHQSLWHKVAINTRDFKLDTRLRMGHAEQAHK